MGDGTKENPYTRKDVLRLIKKASSKAKWLDFYGKEFQAPPNLVQLDLSGKVFEEGIDLRGLYLSGIILKKALLRAAHLEQANLDSAHLEGADLSHAHLERAILDHAHLNRSVLVGSHFERATLCNSQLARAKLREAYLEGADLSHAQLEKVDLKDAHLEGAQLSGTNLKKVNLYQARLSHDTKLATVNWGNYVLGEEKDAMFEWASETYRHLKIWYTEHGLYDIAAKFYYREKEAERKGASRWYKRLAGWFSWAFFGYGEGWKRILIWIAGCILLFALIYFYIGTLTPATFLNSLYRSAAIFITLGIAESITGSLKVLSVIEAFIGFFMMTLLLVTFVRKWIR